MAKIQWFMLSVLLAVLFVMVDSEPLQEAQNVANKGETPNAEPETGANAEPKPEHSAVSMNQAQIWTAFASIFAVWLFK